MVFVLWQQDTGKGPLGRPTPCVQEKYGSGNGNGNGAAKPGTSFSELFKEVCCCSLSSPPQYALLLLYICCCSPLCGSHHKQKKRHPRFWWRGVLPVVPQAHTDFYTCCSWRASPRVHFSLLTFPAQCQEGSRVSCLHPETGGTRPRRSSKEYLGEAATHLKYPELHSRSLTHFVPSTLLQILTSVLIHGTHKEWLWVRRSAERTSLHSWGSWRLPGSS